MRSASSWVGTTTTIGRRVVVPTSAATKSARPASGTDTTASRPTTARSAGSSARSVASGASGAVSVSVSVVIVGSGERVGGRTRDDAGDATSAPGVVDLSVPAPAPRRSWHVDTLPGAYAARREACGRGLSR